MHKFFVTYVTDETKLPEKELLSSVFLFAIRGSKMLAIMNERGWDIPGGHIEHGETPRQALIREVREEGGASFSNEKLFAIVGSDDAGHYKNKVMLMYTTEDFELGAFTPSEDAFGRDVLEIETFLEHYRKSAHHLDLEELIGRAKGALK